jgi:hypothetical protein
MKFIILLVIIIILFLKNIETFTNSDYVIIGNNNINMQNNNIYVLNANDINWQKDSIYIKISDNITIDLIYTDKNLTMNSSGYINRYYNLNQLKQIIIKKKIDNIFTNYYPMSDYYHPMSYPRIPRRHNNFRKHH